MAQAAGVAFGMVILQLGVASSMVLMHLPPVLRSLHEATGVGIWLSCFVLAYLARRVADRSVVAHERDLPAPHCLRGVSAVAARGADL